MAKISIIDSIHAQESQRLDAEYYKPEFLEVLNNILKLKYRKLRELVKEVIGGPFGSTILVAHYLKKGIPFIRVADVKDIFIQTNNLVYVDPSQHKNVDRFILQAGDIVISRVGTLGLFSLLTEDYKNWFLGSNLIAIKGPFKMNKNFLLIFLNSKYGRFQILRAISGQVQGKITTKDVENILIPQLTENFQHHIEQLVKQAYKNRKLAEQKYQQAEELLYQLLGISKEEIEKLEAEKAYETNFKDVREAFRFDAEYYHPKYLGVIELLKKTPFKLKPLKEIAKIKHKKVNPEEEPYRTKKVKYIEIGGIDTAFGEIIKYKEDYGWKLPSGDKYLVKEKDILYSKVRPYRKGIGFVTKEFEGSLVTQGFTVIRCKDESTIPEFLFFYLRSDIGNLPVLRNMSGSTYPTIKDEDVGEILVPIVPKDRQQEIASLVKEYFKLRRETRQLIQRAIREVEEAIENASRSNGE